MDAVSKLRVHYRLMTPVRSIVLAFCRLSWSIIMWGGAWVDVGDIRSGVALKSEVSSKFVCTFFFCLPEISDPRRKEPSMLLLDYLS